MLALLTAGGARAQGDEPHWYLQVDNDVLFHTDRWYSSGVRVARSFPLEGSEAFAGALRPGETARQRVDVGLLHEVYAPDSKHLRSGVVDRAPVGRLFVTLARHDYTADMHQTLELDAGVHGPAALGRQSTQAVHTLITGPRIDWSRQLPDRADVQAAWARSHRFDSGIFGFPAVGLHYGAVAGNHVGFPHVGLDARWGDKETAIAATPLLRFAATPPIEPGSRGRRLSFFVGASARAVVRNTLLRQRPGSLEREPERENVVVRFAWGFTWRPAWGVVRLAIAQDTREFAEQRHPHRFGSLSVHLDLF